MRLKVIFGNVVALPNKKITTPIAILTAVLERLLSTPYACQMAKDKVSAEVPTAKTTIKILSCFHGFIPAICEK
jgi:hypothetical protein